MRCHPTTWPALRYLQARLAPQSIRAFWTEGVALPVALAPQLGGRTVGTYGVNYPAGYDFLTTADGANDAAAHINAMAQQCPATRIVLGGY